MLFRVCAHALEVVLASLGFGADGWPTHALFGLGYDVQLHHEYAIYITEPPPLIIYPKLKRTQPETSKTRIGDRPLLGNTWNTCGTVPFHWVTYQNKFQT